MYSPKCDNYMSKFWEVSYNFYLKSEKGDIFYLELKSTQYLWFMEQRNHPDSKLNNSK